MIERRPRAHLNTQLKHYNFVLPFAQLLIASPFWGGVRRGGERGVYRGVGDKGKGVIRMYWVYSERGRGGGGGGREENFIIL